MRNLASLIDEEKNEEIPDSTYENEVEESQTPTSENEVEDEIITTPEVENVELDEVQGFEVNRNVDDNYFTLTVRNSKSFKSKFTAREVTYSAKMKHPTDVLLTNFIPQLKALFTVILDELRNDYGDSGVARIYIYHQNLEKEIIIPPRYLGDLDPDVILDTIDNVIYSAGDIPADESLDINIAAVEMLKGGSFLQMYNLNNDIPKKKSIIQIKNADNLCLARAIVVSLAHLQKTENPKSDSYKKKYKAIKDSRLKSQGVEALKLMQSAGISTQTSGNLSHIKKYENYLKVSIEVISTTVGTSNVIGGNDQYKRRIFLFHSKKNGVGHFDSITKPNAVLCKQYYCVECRKAFKNKRAHSCKVWCNICGEKNCTFEGVIKCETCNMNCRSTTCYTKHKETKKVKFGKDKGSMRDSYCEQSWQCPDCGIKLKRELRSPEEHICGENKCINCHQFYTTREHLCYMRSCEKNVKIRKFIFFDFECQQEFDGTFGKGEHKPNYCVTQSVCENCVNNTLTETSTCSHCGSRCTYCKVMNKHKEFERETCSGCGKRQVIFEGKSAGTDFCTWLIDKQHSNSKVIAHNARSYDAYFILQHLKENGQVPESNIMAGKKIMFMQIKKGLDITILDSLNFLPMPLASLPKSFGLTELKKGYFPHYLNTEGNQNIKLPQLPEKKFYDPDSMGVSARNTFLTWYEENKNKPFDFQKEMKEYCISDVDILRQSCMKFRQMMIEETGSYDISIDPETLDMKETWDGCVDPFNYTTIASVCLGIFRSKFLPEQYSLLFESNALDVCSHKSDCQCPKVIGLKSNSEASMKVLQNGIWKEKNEINDLGEILTCKFLSSPIAVIPTSGYSGKDNHSKECIEWLYSLEKKLQDDGKNISIQHARSQDGEKSINYKTNNQMIKYKLDGYFEFEEESFACEYYGCNWHGCTSCFPKDRELITNQGKSVGQLFRETMLREKRLKELGYKLITIWSCQFTAERKRSTELNDFVKALNIQDPLCLRDCYFGGRTNALLLHKIFTNDEKGYYMDFTSLYPDVLKYQKYPIGHPQKIDKNFKEIHSEKCIGGCSYGVKCNGTHLKLPYFGIMKVTVLPPTDLLHPVLPIKIGIASKKKLKFPLCYKCAQNESKDDCFCTDNQRQFTHTYCTPELEAAINVGYTIVQVHEVLHWSKTEKYNHETKTGGLFTEYINTFLRLKQQASGYPQHLQTEEEKDQYIANYLDHEGIQLVKENIEKNSGLRSLSKLALNSFYGKFGQRTNMKQTKFLNNMTDFYNLWLDPSKNILDFNVVSEDILQVEYKHSSDFEPLPLNTNVIIAAFCTCWARLKLWKVMQSLGSRVIYHDTDSIIFSAKEGEYIPPLGEYLGDLTDELSCKELACSNKQCSGHFIEEFVSCGPKNYSYRLNSGEWCCKVRGFSLNHRNSQILNFDSMKDALYCWKEGKEKKLITVKTEIVRDNVLIAVKSKQVEKHYRVVYDKRQVQEDLTTLPYGYRK